MGIVIDQKQISDEEKAQVDKQVKVDLVDHLYHGCLPGTISGNIASIALFLDFYNYTPFNALVTWFIGFNLMMFTLSGVYFYREKYNASFGANTWETIYSLAMIGAALSWVPCLYLMPEDSTRQYLALLAIFLASTGYATGTIGQFSLCAITLNIILGPVVVWSLSKGGLFYNILGMYSLIYIFFMLGANYRSTQWFKDSLKLKLENTLVSYQANHDLLTNLPNQRLLMQFLGEEISQAEKNKSAFALLSFSLNRMEMINDSLGFEAGDAIIQSMSNRIQDYITNATKLNENKIQFKLAISRKENFSLIISTVDHTTLDTQINLLFATTEDPFFFAKREIKVTASIGVSIYDRDGKDPQTLFANANAAMLLAKQFGGNRAEYYQAELNSHTPKTLELETDLHTALKRNEFQVYYQPLINLKTNEICGMEALLRWPHHLYGLISPMQFIPIAEETALILPIGEWVLKESCLQTLKWHKMGYDKLRVAVNMSAKQLMQKDILETIERILVETNFDPAFLELEITETAILNEEVFPLLKRLKDIGLSLSVDDFGTGYSGLSYLKRFSVDKLKIDQSFIRDLPENSHSATIVSATLAMAHALKIKTLAEGVETKEQLEFLREKGCDIIQGYYYSKPLEADYFTQFLMSYSKKMATEPVQS